MLRLTLPLLLLVGLVGCDDDTNPCSPDASPPRAITQEFPRGSSASCTDACRAHLAEVPGATGISDCGFVSSDAGTDTVSCTVNVGLLCE
jgi:hypothetical protein